MAAIKLPTFSGNNGQTIAARPLVVDSVVRPAGSTPHLPVFLDNEGRLIDGDPIALFDASGVAIALGASAPRTFSITGDLAWSVTYDGSANVTAGGVLATVNTSVGTFGSTAALPVITVNGKGLVTAVSTAALGTAAVANTDNDNTLAANSATLIATQQAVKAYVDSNVASLLKNKGNLDCSANPNYPAGTNGDAYYVSVAGKIGGASGKTVEVGDVIVCKATNAGGTEASVGTSWYVLQANLVGAIQAGNNGSDFASAATTFNNLAQITSTTYGRSLLALADAAANTAQLNAFTSTLKGLVPLSGGGTTNFLRADGTWAAAGGSTLPGPPASISIYTDSSLTYIVQGYYPVPAAGTYRVTNWLLYGSGTLTYGKSTAAAPATFGSDSTLAYGSSVDLVLDGAGAVIKGATFTSGGASGFATIVRIA